MHWVTILLALIFVALALSFERANLIVHVRDGKAEMTASIFEWESRNRSTFEMIQSVQKDLPDGVYHLWTGDVPVEGCLCYSGPNAIPDFSFLRWTEAKLPDFYDFYAWDSAPNFEIRLDRLLWIGNGTKDFEPRKRIYDAYSAQPEFDIWQISPNTFRTMYQHADYKYLLDIEGRGWSARLKFLLLTGSVVFVMDRPYVEYWHDEFQPWVHYVPVNRDGSNLLEQFQKVRDMPDKGRSIGDRCRQKALEVFEKSRVYSTLQNTLASQHRLSR